MADSTNPDAPPRCHCGRPSAGTLAKLDRYERPVHYCEIHAPADVVRFRATAMARMQRGAWRRRRAQPAQAA